MDSWQRTFAYVSGALVAGLLLIIFTNSLLVYVNNPGWPGHVALFGFGFVFVNLSYGLNRRYVKKLEGPSTASYVIATLLILPTLLWIYTKETALAESRMVFAVTIVFAVYLGAYFGIRSGSKRRMDYIEQLQEEEAIPDDLQRPHDDLNKN